MLSTKIMLRHLSTASQAGSSYKLLPRTIHRSCVARRPDVPNPVSHGVENYFVDGDDTPPNASVYKVDATSDAAESAYEPPSGPWSRAGAGTDEYQTLNRKEPYDVPNGKDSKLRYGGVKMYFEDKAPETSRPDEGPEGTERRGRKPEEE